MNRFERMRHKVKRAWSHDMTPRSLPLCLRAFVRSCLFVMSSLLIASVACATDLKQGEMAPKIEAQTIDGREVNTAAAADQVQIILFGDLSQDRTHEAARRVAAVISDPRLAGARVQWILVLAKVDGVGQFLESLGGGGAGAVTPMIIKDSDRKVFGAHHVVVLPTTFIVDPARRIAHSMAGMSPRYSDSLADAIDLASGRITKEAFEQRLAGGFQSPHSEGRLRAERLTRLGQHLVERDIQPLAEKQFREAIEADATFTTARLLLARLLLTQEKFDEAEAEYRAVIKSQPRDEDAALGVIEVKIRRPPQSPNALDEAQKELATLLATRADWPRARYVKGLLLEVRGDTAGAAAEYRAAAESMLREAEVRDLSHVELIDEHKE